MADGIPCKHCGYQETDHEYRHLLHEDVKLRGYKKTLASCDKFVPKRQPRQKKDDFVMEWWERQACGNAAWGHYNAQVRQANFNRELARKKTREEKEAFIRWGKEQNGQGFYIGPY